MGKITLRLSVPAHPKSKAQHCTNLPAIRDNKLDHDTDDLENSVLIEESVTVGNESMIERPSKKRKNMVNPKKRPLEDGSVIVPAKRPRGRPRKIAA